MQKQSTWGEMLVELDVVDSTNNYAVKRISEGLAENGWSVRANYQTEGRGQMGNTWLAASGENILCSTVLCMGGADLGRQFILNTTFCVALAEALRELPGMETLYIKWPNDLFLNGKKLGGILIENQIRGSQWTYAILGWGINVNQTQFHNIEKASSISEVSGVQYDVSALCRELLNKIQTPLERFLQGDDSGLERYNSLLGKRNERVEFIWQEQVCSGILEGVRATGELAIKMANETRLFKHKEIIWQNTAW